MRLPLHLNVTLRLAFCAGVAIVAYQHYPEIKPAGVFNVFQLSFLVTLCTVPLPWNDLLLLPDVRDRKRATDDAVRGKPVHQAAKSVWPEVETASNGLELAEALSGTPVAKSLVLQFVDAFNAKKAKRLQEGLYRSMMPAVLVSGGILVVAWVVQSPSVASQISEGAQTLLVGLVQALIGVATFTWTIGNLYGEIELAREVARAA